jgi:hypothetical protein
MKEQLAEDYAHNYFVMQDSHYNGLKQGFLAGFDEAKNWQDIKNPPQDDREVLIYVRNLKTPWWSTNQLGSYIDGKWYLREGIKEEYILTRWIDISPPKELKTIKNWNQIYQRQIKETTEEKITERTYIAMVLNEESPSN